jgi:hypothetical protein
MNAKMKKELVNDVLTGLLVAGVLSAVIPIEAVAAGAGGGGGIAGVASAAQSSIMLPFVHFASYISYSLGTIMTVAGIAMAKKHADNPTSTPLAHALGRLGAGAAFLAAPAVAGTLVSTATGSDFGGTASFSPIGGM